MSKPAVHQLLPSFVQSDAVGNLVRHLRQLFVQWGHRSEIFAGYADRVSRPDAHMPEAMLKSVKPDDVVLIHHSIRSGFVPLLKRLRARKVVLYHNITPGEFFTPFEPVVARACDDGRAELRQLAPLASRGYAFSEYSAGELREVGFAQVGVLPFPIDWKGFDATPEPRLLERLTDGRVNVLCVGRVEPNKRIDEALRVFTAFQRLFVPRSRLVVAGLFEPGRPYGKVVRSVLHRLMPDEVLLLGKVSREELSACFEGSHVYLSMSAHEGFGVPLVEAMHRRLPVIANAAAAIPETLGGAGVCVKDGSPIDFARILTVVTQDADVRAGILASQERRLEQLARQMGPGALRTAYGELLEGGRDEARTTADR